MTEVSFLVTLNILNDRLPTKEEIAVIGANIDMGIEVAHDNEWVLPEDSDLEFWHYTVKVIG